MLMLDILCVVDIDDETDYDPNDTEIQEFRYSMVSESAVTSASALTAGSLDSRSGPSSPLSHRPSFFDKKSFGELISDGE